ncbi:GNAT family N-acetyltransferase [Fructilactobacillus hinvesii]|uniref:GNAT family N-acetyltransferase n=1 Tax=Fructilactobacillus hinvesii TaxID=2940300 RepID=A0ABY5BTV2_9LACO|nr:GNAT family N-acetyltransferase [Fructilactobacillus hinvesii]USS88070.1 GNAT family N-acetyltransferase [Fructilactobacillus hinvesii]
MNKFDNIDVAEINSFLYGPNDLKNFNCGNQAINQFLINDASESDKQFQSVTQVFFEKDTGEVIGFCSTVIDILSITYMNDIKYFVSDYIESVQNGLSENLNVPVLHLLFLGVDLKYQHLHVGTAIINYLFDKFSDAYLNDKTGLAGIKVDAFPDAIEFYDKFRFFYLSGSDNDFSIPRKTYPMIKQAISIISSQYK